MRPTTDQAEGRILVVDDDPSTRKIHSTLLSRHFLALTASSGEEALQLCTEHHPDLVLLDCEMPGMDGFETCRKLRERSDLPIIFATSHDSLDEHMRAYDAGGTDLCVKPVSAEILIRKTRMAIAQHHERQRLKAEHASLQQMAMGFMSSMGESGALLSFTRASLRCRSHQDLARNFVEAAAHFGAQCCVAIRHDGAETCWGSNGDVTAIERSVMAQLAPMGRQVQFKKRLSINYDCVSVVVTNMPEESSEQAGRLRDNMTALAETTEALSESVSMRRESSERAEQMQLALSQTVGTVDELRDKHRTMVADVRMLLQELTDNMEQTFSWLATDRSQEAQINHTLHSSAERVLQVLLRGSEFDQDFGKILDQLRGNAKGEDFELF